MKTTKHSIRDNKGKFLSKKNTNALQVNKINLYVYKDFEGCDGVKTFIKKHPEFSESKGNVNAKVRTMVKKRAIEVGYIFPSLEKTKHLDYSYCRKPKSLYKDVFCENSKIVHSDTLRKNIIYYNVFEKYICPHCKNWQCGQCGICEWNNLPITIQIEHINGKHNDNRIENLCPLCPNCHSQTSTYAIGYRATIV